MPQSPILPRASVQAPGTVVPSQHRLDIQVMRGWAVILVVMHHARLPYLPGGFLGVDIFFVISGFLMAGLIDKSLANGNFRLIEFYQRRARRLLPAASATLVITAIAAVFVLEPSELRNFAWQLFGSITMTANVVLWRQSDYFASLASYKPLLHMWSLSVEEQFYLVLPTLMLLTSRRRHLAIISVLTLMSAILCFVMVRIAPSPTFYLFPTRAWELGVGVCTALLLRHGVLSPRILRIPRLLCILTLIIVPIVANDRGHPGLAAALMCVATAVLLIPGSTINIGQLTRPLIVVGDRSYSLYLVHWPLFAFASNIFFDQVPGFVNFALVGVALLLTELQYRFVETPFRHGKWGFREVALFGSAPLALAVACLFVASSTATAVTSARANNAGLSPACDFHGPFFDRGECRSSPTPHTLLWGDSFAMALADGLAESVPGGIEQATRTICGPIEGLAPTNSLWPPAWAKSCLEFNDSVMAYIRAHTEIETVVLASALVQYIPGAEDLGWKFLEKTPTGSAEQNQDLHVLTSHLEATVKALRAAGKRVVLFAPPPSDETDGARCMERASSGKPTVGAPLNCNLNRADYEQMRKPLLQFLQELATANTVPIIYFDQSLCTGDSCRRSIDGVSLYRDGGHLSHPGSRLLGKEMNWGALVDRAAS